MAKEKIAPEETPDMRPEPKKSNAKPKGWHSRRYESPEAHYTAKERYQAEHGPKAKRAKAEARAAEAATRTLEEQLARLNERLGYGLGAAKERARLTAKINARLRAEVATA